MALLLHKQTMIVCVDGRADVDLALLPYLSATVQIFAVRLLCSCLTTFHSLEGQGLFVFGYGVCVIVE